MFLFSLMMTKHLTKSSTWVLTMLQILFILFIRNVPHLSWKSPTNYFFQSVGSWWRIRHSVSFEFWWIRQSYSTHRENCVKVKGMFLWKIDTVVLFLFFHKNIPFIEEFFVLSSTAAPRYSYIYLTPYFVLSPFLSLFMYAHIHVYVFFLSISVYLDLSQSLNYSLIRCLSAFQLSSFFCHLHLTSSLSLCTSVSVTV